MPSSKYHNDSIWSFLLTISRLFKETLVQLRRVLYRDWQWMTFYSCPILSYNAINPLMHCVTILGHYILNYNYTSSSWYIYIYIYSQNIETFRVKEFFLTVSSCLKNLWIIYFILKPTIHCFREPKITRIKNQGTVSTFSYLM